MQLPLCQSSYPKLVTCPPPPPPPPPHGQHTLIDAEDVVQLQQGAVFNASDNVQSGDVACVTLSVVDDDILEPPVEFLVLFEASPDVTVPVESPDFTRVFVMDTTAQGIH